MATFADDRPLSVSPKRDDRADRRRSSGKLLRQVSDFMDKRRSFVSGSGRDLFRSFRVVGSRPCSILKEADKYLESTAGKEKKLEDVLEIASIISPIRGMSGDYAKALDKNLIFFETFDPRSLTKRPLFGREQPSNKDRFCGVFSTDAAKNVPVELRNHLKDVTSTIYSCQDRDNDERKQLVRLAKRAVMLSAFNQAMGYRPGDKPDLRGYAHLQDFVEFVNDVVQNKPPKDVISHEVDKDHANRLKSEREECLRTFDDFCDAIVRSS
jgi:hypothetical protein